MAQAAVTLLAAMRAEPAAVLAHFDPAAAAEPVGGVGAAAMSTRWFFSWAQVGAATLARGGSSLRTSVTFTARRRRRRDPRCWRLAPPCELLGPGDVAGFDPSLVIRCEPQPGATGVAENILAQVELAHADLPWLLAAGTAPAGKLRSRGWRWSCWPRTRPPRPARATRAGAHRADRGPATAGRALGVDARGGPPRRLGDRPGNREEPGQVDGAGAGRRTSWLACCARAGWRRTAGIWPAWCPPPRPAVTPGCRLVPRPAHPDRTRGLRAAPA